VTRAIAVTSSREDRKQRTPHAGVCPANAQGSKEP